MTAKRSLGRQFGWLWAAFAVSSVGTCLAFGAFPLIAITVLGAGPAAVSALAAAGLAVGAVVAVPLGPWVEFRRKRPVMIAMDLSRFAAMLSIPATFALGWLSYAQLLIVAIVTAAADITFKAASGACLKSLLPPEDLLQANGRFESTSWTAIALGPPLGGLLIGLFGPVTTVVADAVSYLLSAAGIRTIGGAEPAPPRATVSRLRLRDLPDGWRYIFGHPVLRRLFLNTLAVNSLIMVAAPLVAVLMLGRLGFRPWQYGLAFGAPCVGGLIGSRLSRPLAARFGLLPVLRVSGALRVCWPVGLAFIGRGAGGLLLVIGVEFGLITCCGIYNPLMASYRLTQTAPERVTRTLSAWSVSSNAATAAMTGLWGLLAAVVGPRAAIAAAGVLLLATPLLLPRRTAAPAPEPALV